MKKTLSYSDFEFYPVWTWDESKEYRMPIQKKSINLLEYEVYFVKSKFYAGDFEFDGYLVWESVCNAFTLFFQDESFKFNAYSRGLNIQSIEKLFQKLKCRWQFFPIRFQSEVTFNQKKISGIINFEF